MKRRLIAWMFLAVMLLSVCGGTVGGAEGALSPGDIVTYGRYEQDNDQQNGPEPIEWIVLDQREGKVLLLSRYVLDAMPFHAAKEGDTWESYGVVFWDRCTLRTWLNGEFLNVAFTPEEQAAILLTDVDNSAAQSAADREAKPGDDTQDQIFLLSYHEAGDLYFADLEARRCAPTDYAASRGVYAAPYFQADGRDTCYWWLRSSTPSHDYHAGAVANVGYLDSLIAYAGDAGVRPALWLDLAR